MRKNKLISKHNIPVLIDVLVLVLIFIFLLSFFQPKLLLLKTTINGGDTGSHYPCAWHLKEVLLPQGKIMGWMQGNYAGFPLFYHYFPLPFLLMAFLAFVIPLEIAFKLVSVFGIFLLPFAIYFSFRALKYSFPVPLFSAIFTLPFLFNHGNSMWGGNIPSTLAGEFCYSLGFAFVFLFFGSLYRGIAEKKHLIFNALLVFLIGFSHAYTLIFCLIIGSFFVFENFRNNFKYLAGVYGLGFLFLSFWMLPVLRTLPFATSFVFRWTINSIFEVFPVMILPFIFISFLAFFVNRRDRRVFYFLYVMAICLFIYFVGPQIGVLDIRFVPFLQMLLILFGATLIDRFRASVRSIYLLPIIIFIACALWVNYQTIQIPAWIKWNYSGYESRETWPVFNGINEYLKQSGGGRVEWEHTPLDESLGSIRSSETLPYFARRQTLEGIHMLGSQTAPFVFYIESETSYQSCNPIPDYYYSTLNLRRGIDHFKLFNVSHYVVRTDQVKKAIKNFPEFRLVKTVGDYHIYRLLTNNDQYVEPLANHPVLFSTQDWRDVSYRWFSDEKLKDTFLVFTKNGGEQERKLFKQAVNGLEQVETVPFKQAMPKVTSKIFDEAIHIETSKIGHPLLVKVSYHPNWKVKGADKVYFVSPSFMLIFPSEHKVYLTFEPGAAAKVGRILTGLGLILAFLSPLWAKRFLK